MARKRDHGKAASGKQITDDLIDKLAAKAEAGYDLSQFDEKRDAHRPQQQARRAAAACGLRLRLGGATVVCTSSPHRPDVRLLDRSFPRVNGKL